MQMEWIVELFREGELISKRMFGGTAHYYQGKMVLVFMQYEGDRTYRGKEYNFDIWNGVLFPVEREAHNTIINRYPPLFSHPVLGKWLYLPFATEDFDETIESIVREIRRGNQDWGIWPKPKKKVKKKAKKRVLRRKTKSST